MTLRKYPFSENKNTNRGPHVQQMKEGSGCGALLNFLPIVIPKRGTIARGIRCFIRAEADSSPMNLARNDNSRSFSGCAITKALEAKSRLHRKSFC
jgi:hypothetical protein